MSAALFLWGCTAILLQNPTDESNAPLIPSGAFESQVELVGMVFDHNGPAEGARVQVQATDFLAETAEDGSFVISMPPATEPITVVAWKKNRYFTYTQVIPVELAQTQSSITLTMKAHHRGDNLNYEWEPSENCAECHTANDEWLLDAHSQTARNPRFLTIYRGTDVDGNRSPNTGYDGGFPDEVDPKSAEYHGPGFKTDFPLREGNCATCHTPMVTNLPTNNSCAWSGCHMETTLQRSDELPDNNVSPLAVKGTATEGISCDFCHTIARVRLDEETSLPKNNMTGILSLSIYRPEPGERFIMGSTPDSARETDSYNPIYEESQYCASCHYGVFSNTVIYGSYGEWLESPYSDAETGQTCQDCHMPIAEQYDFVDEKLALADMPPLIAAVMAQEERNYFVYPEKGGIFRKKEQVHNHQMPGASDERFLQNAVSMETEAVIQNGQLDVTVNILNDQTGHHVPTGSPMRNMLLIIEAYDNEGTKLEQLSGSTLPEWAGSYAEMPGKGFAKILRDQLTGESPTVAQWRYLEVESDNRIPAMGMDSTQVAFALSTNQTARVEVRLIFRRAFQQLAEWKGWRDPDIVMEEAVLHVNSP
ncbi:MAG: hypothetical protein AAF702_36625 [Chloroflexota bacterium]